MFETICYFLILLTVLAVCVFTRNKTITFGERIVPSKGFIGKYILAEYVVIAFFSVICLKMGLVVNHKIRMWPYLLMVISILTMLSPFLEKDPKSVDLTKVEYSKLFSIITVVYLIATIFVTFILWDRLQSLISTGAWGANRILGYTGNDEVIYRNGIEWLSINIVNYLKIIAMVIMMYYFVNNVHRLWAILLFIATFLNTVTISMYSSSRGTMFNYMLLLIMMYLLYRRQFEKNLRRSVDVILVSLGSVALTYAIAVTDSRFGGGVNSSRDSLIFYFGHSPIVFNQGVSTIIAHSYGGYSLYGILNLLSIYVDFSQELIGGTWGKQFYTYIGAWYIDFGTIGVVLLSIIYARIVKRLMRKDIPRISNCFAIFFAASFMIEGAFVIGRTYCLTLLANIGIFLILYYIERRVRWRK